MVDFRRFSCSIGAAVSGVRPAVAAAVLALGIGHAGSVAAQPREFRIINGTQSTITELRYRTPDGQFPAQNALNGQIQAGAQRRFALDPNMPCVWDIRVGFAGAEATVMVDLDLCRGQEVRVTETGATDVIVRNRTNQDIASLRTRVPARGDFGQSILQSPIRAGQSGVITIAYASFGCLRDLRAGYADNQQQTRRRANMCNVREMEFDTPSRNEFFIENQSQQPIVSIFTRPPGAEWAEIRGMETVQPGGLSSLQGNISQTCMREIRAVFANRQEAVSQAIDVCAADRIAVTASGIAGIMPQGAANTGPAQPSPGPGTGAGQQPPPQPPQQPQQPQGPIAGPPAGARVVTMVNTWHITIREIYLRTPGTENRGPDVLGDRVLDSRREINIPLPGQGCRFDIVAVYGDEYGFTVDVTFRNADLCQMRRVELNGPAPGTQLGGGTGFYATRNGLIVTNRHVTRLCNSVRLQIGGSSVPLEMIVDDPVNDLAILRGPSRATPSVTFRAEGQQTRLGEQVLAIGYPIGAAVGNQVFPVSGSISAVAGRQGRDSEFSMTAPINPGHSGGPVFDESGLLIGVAVAGITRIGDRNIQNVTFGIRASVLRRLLRSINAEVEEAPPGASIRLPDLIDRSLPMVLNLACYS